MKEIDALCLLTTIPQLGSVKIRLMLGHFGSALKALQADVYELAELPGFGPKIIKDWDRARQSTQWKEIIYLCEANGIEMIPITSDKYPKKLLEIVDPPILLYVKGSLLKQDQRSIAVIGTRQASIYGKEMAKIISEQLAYNNFTVVSGLARGIDKEAHFGALTHGRTIGVIGSGLLNVYPKENMVLAEKIIEKGALISEFPPLTPPDKQTFPQRNRIVSGLSLGTVLIEAPEKSGAMITVRKALDQDRPVFALPGRVDQPSFRGNHYLIKNRYATLIENGTDVVSCFDTLLPSLTPISRREPISCFEPEEKEFLACLPANELSIEQILELTQLPMAKINVLLMSLVLKKGLKTFPGKIYKKVESIPYG